MRESNSSSKETEAIEVRLNKIAEDIEVLLKNFKPEVVAVEQLYSHYAHPRTAVLMGTPGELSCKNAPNRV